MTKHTPGPWMICYWSDGGARYIGPDNTQWVARIAEDNIPEDIRLANARLIAAAPDLLEALQEACDLALGDAHEPSSKCVDTCDNPIYCGEEWAIAQKARAAIAKAKGK